LENKRLYIVLCIVINKYKPTTILLSMIIYISQQADQAQTSVAKLKSSTVNSLHMHTLPNAKSN